MKNVKVLFVDDEVGILRALGRTLKDAEFMLFFTTSTDEALTMIREETIDVVVSDHALGSMTGLQLLATIASERPHTVRVLMSGDPTRASSAAALGDGRVQHVIDKPWDNAALKALIVQIVGDVVRKRDTPKS